MARSIVVLLGHPDARSFCGALAERYTEAARDAGHSVHLFRLGELDFDPVLRQGYRLHQPLEPDLQRIADSIRAADHLVLVYPVWWGGMPALLKGLIDRIFLPGFAFRYREGFALWDKLLGQASAHVIQTLDTPHWYDRWVNGLPAVRQIKRAILQFCGVHPVRVTRFAPIRQASERQRQRWLDKIQQAGRAAV